MKLVEEIRGLSKEGYSKRAISRMLDLNRETVRKYLTQCSVENGNKGRRKPSMLDPYKVQIERMLSEKRSNRDIFEILRADGYRGSYSSLGIYISKMKRELGIEVVKEHQVRISKKYLIKLMYKPIEECEVVTEGMYEKIIEKYPIIKRMVDLIARFKEIMKSSEVEMLEEWMAEAKSLRIRKIDKFVKGMKRDIEAVRNAIRYEYNNGLAEGSVNKLKVIKRIMYGRSKFGLLRAKLLLIEGNG
jgi:transposase